MKKIGLLNFHYSDHNYGAVLQASALENYIKDNFTLDIEHIDFVPLKNKKSLRVLIGDFLRLIKVKKKIVKHDVENSIVFEDFREKWITRSSRIEDKRKLSSENYWLVIVGSDQVWRPRMTRPNELAYFLSFCDDSCLRVSYAASFGIDHWEYPEKLTKKINRELDKFTAISCREITGTEICNDVFSKDATLVLDPTLLIGMEFFDKIINTDQKVKNRSEGNIVYYKLDLDDNFRQQVLTLESELLLESTNIYYDFDGETNKYLSVPSWLNSIKQSKIVITDSFHCVCLSILFNKPFLFYPNKGRGLARLESLLTILGLQHLICYDNVISSKKEAFEIDYKIVNEKLKMLREQSHSFLENIITEYKKTS